MDYNYPLLRKVFDNYKDHGLDLSNVRLYSCQHLLGPQLEMYKLLISFGIQPQNIIALGKAYSTNTQVMNSLKGLGVRVMQPEFSGISFDQEHINNCEIMLSEVLDTHRNVILDDGGQLILTLKDKKIEFAVEQTSSGFRKLEGVTLDFPMYNVARSPIKLLEESRLIGLLSLSRVEDYIRDKGIVSPKIVIIGLGPIGNSLLKIFKEEGKDIVGFDVETKKGQILSYIDDNKVDVVIGATGTMLFNASDLDEIKGGHVCHLISVSSSDREFPVTHFRKHENVHEDVKYKNFIFVNNGFPINFKGNKYESTPVEIEKTIALLLGSVLHGLAKGSTGQKGIISVPDELEKLVDVGFPQTKTTPAPYF